MNRDHIVRPRWVWTGLALALLGACLLAYWIATWRLSACVAGAVLLVLGGAIGVRGGILYDTHGARSVTGDVGDVEKNRVHRGTAPGDMITDPRLRQEARETARMTDALLHAAEESPRPAFDKLGAGLMLVAAVFLLFAQAMYPHTHTGQDNALRSLLLAAVTALAALRILLGQRPGLAPSGIAGLVGLALILLAVLTNHDRASTVIVEITAGAWILLAALLSLDRPRDSTPARETPAVSTTPSRRRALAASKTAPRPVGGPVWSDNVRVAGVAVVIGTAVFWSAHAARRLAHRS